MVLLEKQLHLLTINLREDKPLPKDWVAGGSMKVFAAPRNLGKHTAGKLI